MSFVLKSIPISLLIISPLCAALELTPAGGGEAAPGCAIYERNILIKGPSGKVNGFSFPHGMYPVIDIGDGMLPGISPDEKPEILYQAHYFIGINGKEEVLLPEGDSSLMRGGNFKGAKSKSLRMRVFHPKIVYISGDSQVAAIAKIVVSYKKETYSFRGIVYCFGEEEELVRENKLGSKGDH